MNIYIPCSTVLGFPWALPLHRTTSDIPATAQKKLVRCKVVTLHLTAALGYMATTSISTTGTVDRPEHLKHMSTSDDLGGLEDAGPSRLIPTTRPPDMNRSLDPT